MESNVQSNDNRQPILKQMVFKDIPNIDPITLSYSEVLYRNNWLTNGHYIRFAGEENLLFPQKLYLHETSKKHRDNAKSEISTLFLLDGFNENDDVANIFYCGLFKSKEEEKFIGDSVHNPNGRKKIKFLIVEFSEKFNLMKVKYFFEYNDTVVTFLKQKNTKGGPNNEI